ncbi:hypothetical protein HY212_03160 [Candidatus Pacearchaeota archaeon]|nr:hypothetical protein [Candidatus Pacearchaeota archaeon]
MDISIYGIYDALNFQPSKPTYAIRIKGFTDIELFKKGYPSLKESPNWIRISEYMFEDVQDSNRAGNLTNDLAQRIVKDFKEYKDKCEALFVHCFRGQNRSPAVAMALNDIFNLGVDSKVIRSRFPKATPWVYGVIKKAAGIKPYYLPPMPQEFYKPSLSDEQAKRLLQSQIGRPK